MLVHVQPQRVSVDTEPRGGSDSTGRKTLLQVSVVFKHTRLNHTGAGSHPASGGRASAHLLLNAGT